MSVNLTPEQKAKLQEYIDSWKAVGLRTETMDKDKALESVKWIYANSIQRPMPDDVRYVSSPMEAQILLNKVIRGVDYNADPTVKLEFYDICRSNWWMASYAFYDFTIRELYPDKTEEYNEFLTFLQKAKEFHMIWTFDKMAVISDFPSEIHLTENYKMHNLFDGALVYRDGFKIHSLDGQPMKKDEWYDKTKQFHSTLAKSVFQKI